MSDEESVVEVRPSRAKCRDCHYRVTWAEQKRQYQRAIGRGLSPALAKASGPRCQKCMTAHLNQIGEAQ